MATSFRYATGRDPWERQTGEPAEEFDWFTHWLNDGHRRSFVRTGEKFAVKRDRVARVARQNRWNERAESWRLSNSRQVQERFETLVEQALVPFAQGMARLSMQAVTGPVEDVPADKALTAATGALRAVKEPSVRELIRIAGTSGDTRDIDMATLIMNRLEQDYPEAHDAVLDAIEDTANPGTTHTTIDSPDSDGDGGGS